MDSTSAATPALKNTGNPGTVFVAAWGAYPWLRAGFSSRQGGTSTAYSAGGPGELNLGWTDSDDPANVAENRRILLAAVAGDHAEPLASPANLVTLRQIHGDVVHCIAKGAPYAFPERKALLHGDGLITQQPGLVLGIQTADCVPILIADTRTRAVAAFHAGWRGTVARIVEQGIAAMQQNFGSNPPDLVAAIGPAIRACCFVVGEDVRAHFTASFDYAPALFAERAPANAPRTLHADLHEANRRQLLAAGVAAHAITLIPECSACTRLPGGRRKYFSHRAEHGFTGRMMSVIGTVA